MSCENCKYAEIHTGCRTMKAGNITMTQTGGNNLVCRNNSPKSISITNGDLQCSGFTPREEAL